MSSQDMGASSASPPTALASLRGQAASRLEQSRSSHGAEDSIAAWFIRDEAYRRMIAATEAGDEAAYRQAYRDFWGRP